MEEFWSSKPAVGSSNLSGPASSKQFRFSSEVEQHLDKVLVGGSIPPTGTNDFINKFMHILNQLPEKKYFDQVRDIVNKIEEQNYKDQINECYLDSFIFWKKSYDNIKGPEWPECNHYSDFEKLPNWIKFECEKIHEFSPSIWLEEISKSFTLEKYDPLDIVYQHRIKNIVLDNIEFIKGYNLIDFGCRYGEIALACMHNGAKSVTATDIRKDNIFVVEQLKNIIGYKNFYTEISDIHDYNKNVNLTKNKDTVLLCGLLYHVHDHYEIIKSIAKSKPLYIIIDTEENEAIKHNPEPLIHWSTESRLMSMLGWDDEQSNILVGHPNTAWLDLSMSLVGYEKIKETKFLDDSIIKNRSIHVYGRVA